MSTMRNKYGAIKTYSELCGRTFDSKAEARHGEELRLLELAGKIKNLEYQIPFKLCDKPRIKITIDFKYRKWDGYIEFDGGGYDVYEDVKGILTRDSRTKLAWLKEKYYIDVKLIR